MTLRKLSALGQADIEAFEKAKTGRDASLEMDQTFRAHEITVHYQAALDGGGTSYGQLYRDVLADLYPGRRFGGCFEWCSGPGFIGFDLLSRGFCDRLFLSDIYLPAMQSVAVTVQSNADHCRDRVMWHHCASVADLPKDWRFDLVVANPPHWNPDSDCLAPRLMSAGLTRISHDPGWAAHRDFFDNIQPYLMPDAVILLQEQCFASAPQVFEPMIEQNRLSINDCYWYDHVPSFYFMEIKQKGTMQ